MDPSANRLRSFLSSRWGVLIKIAVSLGILLWFALRIDYPALGSLLAAGKPALLIALAGVSLLRTAIAVFRFRLLSDLLKPIALRELFRQKFIAAYFNNFLPTALGGDAVRVFMLADCGLRKQQAAVLILIERLMGFFALVLLAVAGALAFDLPAGIELTILALAVAFAGAVTALLAGRATFDGLAGRFPFLERAWRALALLSASRKTLAAVLGLSLVFQTVTVSLSWLVAAALSIDVSFAACLALVPLVWVFTMVPISLGGIGVREAAFTYLFGRIGVPLEASLLISLGTFASLLLNGLIGAVMSFTGSVLGGVTESPESSATE